MAKYIKKPVVIEAEQFFETAPLPFQRPYAVCQFDGKRWFIETLEGPLNISDGDWIIRGVKGEFYPCKPDIFASGLMLVDADKAPQSPEEEMYWDEEEDLTCEYCGGSGGDPFDDGISPCPECDGEGYRWWE